MSTIDGAGQRETNASIKETTKSRLRDQPAQSSGPGSNRSNCVMQNSASGGQRASLARDCVKCPNIWAARTNLEFAKTSGYDPASTMEKHAPANVERVAQAGCIEAIQGTRVAAPFRPRPLWIGCWQARA